MILLKVESTHFIDRFNPTFFDLDFKYWEDAADEYRDQQGSLLPLWVFQYEMTKKLACTNIAWNTHYVDLFAVAFGSCRLIGRVLKEDFMGFFIDDFLKQSHGLFLIYSLKNPSFPENIFHTESGVMSLDFHPQHSNLLCCGKFVQNSIDIEKTKFDSLRFL